MARSQNSDFRIIGIRPLDKCNPDILKSLQTDVLYKFSTDFTFDKQGNIKFNPTYPGALFNTNKINIHISAVAGRNGSGKSSLFDLLFAGLYNLSLQEELLEKDFVFEGDNDSEENGITTPPKDIHFDLYCKIDEQIYHIKFENSTITYKKYTYRKDNDRFELSNEMISDIESLKFFYTIVVNYSFYALNSKELGLWIKQLFHKNDSYQTPIVINPLRKKGNIDINKENALIRSRLLFNLLTPITTSPEKSLRNLSPGKTVQNLILTLDDSKFDNTIQFANHFTEFTFSELLDEVYEVFLGDRSFEPEVNYYNNFARIYIINKLKNIAETYEQYKQHRKVFVKRNLILDQYKSNAEAERRTAFISYLKDIIKDNSHITFKLRRAIHFLQYDFIQKDGKKTAFSIAELSDAVKTYKNGSIPLLHLLPPSFLKADIVFDNGNFDQLSSGEKQKIYSTNSIIYHLINLNSVKENNLRSVKKSEKLLKYRHVNCIFDEIELYYHPELQRTFIHDLLESLEKADLPDIDCVNFTFITHSPFILSDIPRSNILYLKLNNASRSLPIEAESESFAANIYDLLADSFYFDSGFIGERAKSVIQRVIDNLQEDVSKDTKKLEKSEIRSIIELIGEPILKDKLIVMFEDKFKDKSLKTDEIQLLERRLKKLRQ